MEISQTGTLVIIISCLFLLMGLFVLSFFLVYRKNQNARESQIENLNQALLVTQIEIQEQTLKTISQEIHDNIGQVLSLAKLNLNTFPENTDAVIQTKIDATRELVSKAIVDLRDLSRSMHGDKINELGLTEAIAGELKMLQNTGQFGTRLQVTGEAYRLQPQKETILFRMVQEGLNNAIKHSKAKNIEVQVLFNADNFELAVRDDGVGFDPAMLQSAATGIGLKSMQNRAALIGGVFSVFSGMAKGTTISIKIKNNQPGV
jgi:two-component system, NarL family, sensor kinase